MMTAEREAMTLERQAFEAYCKENGLPTIKVDGGQYAQASSNWAWAGWLAAMRHLSRAAEPVGELVRLGSSPYTGEYGSVFWRDNTPPPCGTKLYAHPSEDARDAKRYRWLRDKSGRAGSPYIRCDDPPFKPMDYWITAGTADSCIDRAMAKESGNE